jgi:hypothetical protein
VKSIRLVCKLVGSMVILGMLGLVSTIHLANKVMKTRYFVRIKHGVRNVVMFVACRTYLTDYISHVFLWSHLVFVSLVFIWSQHICELHRSGGVLVSTCAFTWSYDVRLRGLTFAV